MLLKVAKESRLLLIVVFCFLLAGCGGGGGGRSAAPVDPPAAPPATTVDVTGQVMLGVVRNVEVRITGDASFDPVSGMTDEFGAFGPLAIAENYSGPLLIEAVPTSDTTFVCDSYAGCPGADGSLMPFGAALPLNATMRLYLADGSQAHSGVAISPFSTAAASRADVLGGQTAGAIQQANNEMDAFLNELFAVMLENGELEMPLPFYRYQLFDLRDPDIEESLVGSDRVAMLLTLLGASLFAADEYALRNPELSAETFLAQFSAGFNLQGALPLASFDSERMSLEKLAFGVFQNIQALSGASAAREVIVGALRPLSLFAMPRSVLATIIETDQIETSVSASFRVTDAEVGTEPTLSIPLFLNSGAQLDAQTLSVRSDDPRMTVQLQPNGQSVAIEMTLDADAFETPLNQFFLFQVVVTSSDPNVRSLFLEVDTLLGVFGLQAIPGRDYRGYERQRIRLEGSSNRPQLPVSFSWSQVSGPQVTIEGADQAAPTIILPELEAHTDIVLELTVTDDRGGVDTQQTTIRALRYVDFSNVNLTDADLDACIDDLASGSSLTDAGSITSLDCAGREIKSLAGISVLRELRVLDLSDVDFLGGLEPLLELQNLETLDVSGQRFLQCDQVAQLVAANPSLTIVGGDSCSRAFSLNLFGKGHDTEVDSVNQRLFVSIPERQEIAVIDLGSLELVQRISTPGKPRGMSVSLDGTRLFVALYEANSVLVMQLDDLSMQTIALGTATGAPYTNDVVEAQEGRLIVTTGSSSRSRAVQVMLGTPNTVSRIASDRAIQTSPTVVAGPNGDFAYIFDFGIYKLDLSDPDAPIIAFSPAAGSGADMLLNADGTLLALGDGEVLQTGPMTEDSKRRNKGGLGASQNPALYYVIQNEFDSDNGDLFVHRFDSSAPIAIIPTACASERFATQGLSVFGQDDTGFGWVSGDRFCGIAPVASVVVDPAADLQVLDPELEACIRSSALVAGVTKAADLTALTCSAAGGSTVQSLVGLERFTNLLSLNLDGAQVNDLRALRFLWRLDSLSIRDNQQLSQLSPLLDLTLEQADFSGSGEVSCAQLQVLRDNGVSLTSDGCADIQRFELNGAGHAVIENSAGTSLYVSVPTTNTIYQLDSATLAEQRQIMLSDSPTGISLSPDQATLAVALSGAGAVALIDLATEAIEVISVQPEMDSLFTWDVAFLTDQRLVVTGNPPPGDDSYVVELRLDLGNRLARVAGGRAVRAGPELRVSLDRSSVYVGTDSSLNVLYKLDASQDLLPILVERDYRSVSDTQFLAVSANGDQLFAGNGARLDAADFSQTGRFGSVGVPLYIDANTVGFIEKAEVSSIRPQALVTTFDAMTLEPRARRFSGCPIEWFSNERLEGVVMGSGSLAILSADLVCLIPDIGR